MMTSRTTATQFPIFGIVLLGSLVASLLPVTLLGQSVQPAGGGGPGPISLSITESIDPVVAGSGPGNLTYTLKATHSGSGTASDVAIDVTFMLPTGVMVDSVTPGAGMFVETASPDGTWTTDVPAGMAGVTLTAVLTVGPSTLEGVDAITMSASKLDMLRIVPLGMAPTTSESTTVETDSDLSVTKTDGVTEATAGSAITYTIVVTNLGPSDTTTDGVEFEDYFDGDLDCFWTSVARGRGVRQTWLLERAI